MTTNWNFILVFRVFLNSTVETVALKNSHETFFITDVLNSISNHNYLSDKFKKVMNPFLLYDFR